MDVLFMKATDLLEKIRENLKDYPIDYLKRKATDDRYPDSITKRLAIYNSSIYDEIYAKDIEEDYEIRDEVIKNIEDELKRAGNAGQKAFNDIKDNYKLYTPKNKYKDADIFTADEERYEELRIKGFVGEGKETEKAKKDDKI